MGRGLGETKAGYTPNTLLPSQSLQRLARGVSDPAEPVSEVLTGISTDHRSITDHHFDFVPSLKRARTCFARITIKGGVDSDDMVLSFQQWQALSGLSIQSTLECVYISSAITSKIAAARVDSLGECLEECNEWRRDAQTTYWGVPAPTLPVGLRTERDRIANLILALAGLHHRILSQKFRKKTQNPVNVFKTPYFKIPPNKIT